MLSSASCVGVAITGASAIVRRGASVCMRARRRQDTVDGASVDSVDWVWPPHPAPVRVPFFEEV
ncbi:hypothetical protein K523DRAFT_323720 [Schizophyllum commune Tattone D]|nr:hypothetical protein K523DRAFT_323720 [Schizophyllum commune Tattone D]